MNNSNMNNILDNSNYNALLLSKNKMIYYNDLEELTNQYTIKGIKSLNHLTKYYNQISKNKINLNKYDFNDLEKKINQDKFFVNPKYWPFIFENGLFSSIQKIVDNSTLDDPILLKTLQIIQNKETLFLLYKNDKMEYFYNINGLDKFSYIDSLVFDFSFLKKNSFYRVGSKKYKLDLNNHKVNIIDGTINEEIDSFKEINSFSELQAINEMEYIKINLEDLVALQERRLQDYYLTGNLFTYEKWKQVILLLDHFGYDYHKKIIWSVHDGCDYVTTFKLDENNKAVNNQGRILHLNDEYYIGVYNPILFNKKEQENWIDKIDNQDEFIDQKSYKINTSVEELFNKYKRVKMEISEKDVVQLEDFSNYHFNYIKKFNKLVRLKIDCVGHLFEINSIVINPFLNDLLKDSDKNLLFKLIRLDQYNQIDAYLNLITRENIDEFIKEASMARSQNTLIKLYVLKNQLENNN